MAGDCAICAHPDVGAIDARLRRGDALRTLAAAYKVSRSGLHRHKVNHLDRAPRAVAALDGPPVVSGAAGVARTAAPPPGPDATLEQWSRWVLAQLGQEVAARPGRRDRAQWASLVRALTDALRLHGRGTGELAPSGAVTVNVGVMTAITDLQLAPAAAEALLRDAAASIALPDETKVERALSWSCGVLSDDPAVARRLAPVVLRLAALVPQDASGAEVVEDEVDA